MNLTNREQELILDALVMLMESYHNESQEGQEVFDLYQKMAQEFLNE